MIARVLRAVGKAILWLTAGIAGLLLLILLVALSRWLWHLPASVTLPNGMMLKRSFNFTWAGRNDLLATDGRTVLVHDVEGVCFNDRYVEAIGMKRGGGVFDGATNERLPFESHKISGLNRDRRTCGGAYFTAMTGADFFYPGNRAPFLPSCDWRNVDDPSLRHREWFERPCDDRPTPIWPDQKWIARP